MQMQQPLPTATIVDRVAFLVGTVCAIWLAAVFAVQGFRSWWALLLFIPVWAIMAYLVLPRLHRLLSDLYVPDYFFGRTRTADGLLGDPVNLGVDGSAEQLDTAMRRAGWIRADEITAGSTWRIIASTLTRRSYPSAPVSPLMLFGRRHDVAYQQEVEGNPKQRHHVRFWHCPPGWLLPGGAHADWLGAGTYDTDVGLSLFTLQITHRIDENTDEERDFVVDSATSANPEVRVRTLHDFTTGYHSRNGGGDRFITDGNLPILDVTGVPLAEEAGDRAPGAPAAASPDPGGAPEPPAGRVPAFETQSAEYLLERVPLSVSVAVGIIVLGGLLDLVFLLLDPEVRALWGGDELESIAYGTVATIGGLLTVAQLLMGWFVLRGGRRARVVLMVLLFVGILGTAINYLDGTSPLQLNATLLTASLMCLALLALSSESAGAWARRSRRPRGRGEPPGGRRSLRR
ncbi:LssY C-terminal domain-containing protein [Leucobacter sp. CSA2]|uniref:LssY C-terminal domain-containing protein n=2 Tax=Leucobacter edaphi TaxID=2796472 RepID=A0A934UYJ9_9MICO|nr:LssY C-terminal domain-containing protein [Leucobacter edaphi]